MTRSSTKMDNEFKNLLDDAVKSLASKEDIDSLKILIKDQWHDKRVGIENSKVRGNGYNKSKKPLQDSMKEFPYWKVR